MGRRQFKSQASSSRAASGFGFSGFSASTSSSLSYLTEPPNLTSVSDSNVVVALKNLSKRDDKTKSKALEDLTTYVLAHPFEEGGTEEPVLEAWVKFYPRLSIESSRRVRELSHNLQFELLKSARKRMEKYISKVVGVWLAGTYDQDRAVARAAVDGITSFLDTEDKILLFWRKCQAQILAYAEEAINETPQTLSDERTTSADDMMAKYHRVVGFSISLLLNLLLKLSGDDVSLHLEKYEQILIDEKNLWTQAAGEDSFVRRTVNQLLIVCLDKQPSIIAANIDTIGPAFVGDALKSSQSGSAFQLIQSLSRLTVSHPEVWHSSGKGKNKVASRLRHFVEKGSQGGPSEYWQALRSLLSVLPGEVLPTDSQSATEFLLALRTGITNRDEQRSSAHLAWSNYFAISKFIIGNLSELRDGGKVFQESVYPVFQQHLNPTTENSRWSISSKTALVTAYMVCQSIRQDALELSFLNEWQRLANDFINRLQTTLPEQSKDYQKSQDAVVAEGQRWFDLLSEINKVKGSTSSFDFMGSPSTKVINTALAVMINRNGKPYSAAATLESGLRLVPKLFEDSSNLAPLTTGLEDHLPMLIISPSAPYLVSILFCIKSLPAQEVFFEMAWQSAMTAALSVPPSSNTFKILTQLISRVNIASLVHSNSSLQTFLQEAATEVLNGRAEAWPLVEAMLTFNSLKQPAVAELLLQVLDCLNQDTLAVSGALKILETIVRTNPTLIATHDTRVALLTKLIALTELSDPTTVRRVTVLRGAIEKSSDDSRAPGAGQAPIIHIIQEGLESANAQSLHVKTLSQQAKLVWQSSEDPAVMGSLLPNSKVWFTELSPSLSQPPNPVLAVVRPFAGAVYLVKSDSTHPPPNTSTDSSGFSVALRMAMYTASLITEDKFSLVPRQLRVEILYLLFLTAGLVSDQIDLSEDNKLFLTNQNPAVLDEIREFLAQVQACMASIAADSRSWRRNLEDAVVDTKDSSAAMHELIFKLVEECNGTSLSAYYSAKALSQLMTKLVDAHGWHYEGGELWLSKLDVLKSSTQNILGAIAILTSICENLSASKLVNNFCNRLISDVAGVTLKSGKGLPLLTLLNATLSVYGDGDLPIANNRLVFAVKNILSWTPNLVNTNLQLPSEMCYALQRLLPAIKEVYGAYWATTLAFCVSIWNSCRDGFLSNDRLPMIGMSLKLYSILRNLKDANDDLDDSLTEYKSQIFESLICLLKLQRPHDTQPLEYVDDLLSRLVVNLPTQDIRSVSGFYPLVVSDFRIVQSGAYDILNKALPEAQQQLSVDVVLEKRDAKLPEELLSLLLDAPSIHNYSEEELTEFPTPIRGYLLSWHLIYDSYLNASHKVRDDYTEILKMENSTVPLFTFLFDVLGHSAGNPINLDREHLNTDKIRNYDLWEATDSETKESDMYWLLINIYYLSLKFTPNLVKTWWMDCKSKQTRVAVESWTVKYFSPLIIQEALDDVTKWADEQESTSDDEKDLIVRVSKKSREVFASYEIDDTTTDIVIRLPEIFPLEGVKVEGLNRVAASEKKWTSWLMITQGAITFSNGSIIDGLIVFRKNIIGTLKNQTECAICYSIISAGKRIPDKRCQTCKNTFHSDCLFKWFSTSNQSTCPLCRNPFTFGSDSGARRARDRRDPDLV